MFITSLLTFALSSGHAQDFAIESTFSTPTKLLKETDYPQFIDDLELQGFELAAERQLAHFNTMALSGTIMMGGKAYPLKKVRDSLATFMQLVQDFKNCKKTSTTPHCFANLNGEIRNRFNVFAPHLVAGDPRFGEPQDSFFTGYATQPITAKSKPDATFAHAIYKDPSGAAKGIARGQIDFHGGLSKKGLEIAYAPNLYDLYLLHVEGGGYVTLQDGGVTKHFYLSYDGTNGQKWSWISKYMQEKGYINNLSQGAQRKFLRMHPEKAEEIFSSCASYVFFKVSDTPPAGSQGIPVSPGRSLAMDNKLYAFKGMLAFVVSERPKDLGAYDLEEEDNTRIQMQTFSRFFLDQDTGGAITGKGRADIYFGMDDYAQYAATYQQQKGNIYFLLLK